MAGLNLMALLSGAQMPSFPCAWCTVAKGPGPVLNAVTLVLGTPACQAHAEGVLADLNAALAGQP